MYDVMVKFFSTHVEVFMFAIFHFVSMTAYSYMEYKIGISKKIPENSFWEILKNKLWKK